MVCDGITGGGIGKTPEPINVCGVKISGAKEVKELRLGARDGSLFVAAVEVTMENGVKVTLDPKRTAENQAAKASIFGWSSGTTNSTSTSFSQIKGFSVKDTEKKDNFIFKGCQTDGGTIDTTSSGYKSDIDEITVQDYRQSGGAIRKSNVEIKANRGDIINKGLVTRSGIFSNENIPEYSKTYHLRNN